MAKASNVAGVVEDLADGSCCIDDGFNWAFVWLGGWIFDDFDLARRFDDGGCFADFIVDVFEDLRLWAIWIKFRWIAWESLMAISEGFNISGVV